MQGIFIKMKHVAIVLTLLGGAAACSDFLDQPVSGNFSEIDFYKTEEDAQNALIAAYDSYSSAYNHVWASVYLLRDIPSDDVNAGGADGQDQLGHQNIDDFNIDSQNDQIQAAWGNLWGAIYRANKCINTTNPEFPNGKKIIAEAKVVRALIYMDLVGLWGAVPLIKEDVPQSDFGTLQRTPKADVLAFLAEDLAAAEVDLPAKSDLSAGDKFRAHKGTAQALRGKALLWSEQWAEAATQFEEVINSNEYALESNNMAPFNKMNEFGKESLFELNYGGDNGGNFPWGGNSDDNIIVQLMGPREDYYSKAPSDSLIGGWGFNSPTQDLYDDFEAAGDTDRRDEFVWSQETLEQNGGSWSKPSHHDYEGFIRRKYGTFNNQTTPNNGYVNFATNFVLLRYSDVLLMAAEAQFRNNNEGKAKEYLNMVRSRPSTGLPDVTATGTALFNAIVLERRLELAFEGHRFIDLVRWGLADDELSDIGFIAGKHEVFPIPRVDVVAGNLEQNPNY
jgi:starch-binding outer membrane protein, SusD/RagB family